MTFGLVIFREDSFFWQNAEKSFIVALWQKGQFFFSHSSHSDGKNLNCTKGRSENTERPTKLALHLLTQYTALTSCHCHVNGLSGVHREIIRVVTKRRTEGSLRAISVTGAADDEAVCVSAFWLGRAFSSVMTDTVCSSLKRSRMEPDGRWHCVGDQNNTSGEIDLHMMMAVLCALSQSGEEYACVHHTHAHRNKQTVIYSVPWLLACYCHIIEPLLWKAFVVWHAFLCDRAAESL